MIEGNRSIRRLLVANRGEIASRIVSSARELGIETFAVYTDNDFGHIYNAAHAVQLPNPAAYMDVDVLLQIVKQHGVDAVHPGYGFLSESSELARQMAEANVIVIGPGAENLDRTGDKLRARLLAVECQVPVLPALTEPTSNWEVVRTFAQRIGLPMMVKAVDGGGGRGIRLIRDMENLQSLVSRAIEESPSKQVFAEKAAVDGYRHVEVQIVGDGRGNVMHLWERECSIQRRYQKIVELAPSTISDRRLVVPVIEAAVRMAKKIRYASLGTFEFLLNPITGAFFFLEVNPRLQVEHTVTESICGIDIVQAQLRLAQGATFAEAGLEELSQDPSTSPKQYSIQLRITAEDPEKNYALSIGKIQSFHFSSGNGIRVDTALVQGAPSIVGSDFDSVIAKVIVTARSWKDVVSKAQRAMEDTVIIGVTTNVSVLRAIAAHPDFKAEMCDTQWLETKHEELLAQSRALSSRPDPLHNLAKREASTSYSAVTSASSNIFRKDDAWSVALKKADESSPRPHHLQLTKILRNDFPSFFAAEISFTAPGSKPEVFTIDMANTRASASAISSQHRQGSLSDSTHIVVPFSGKLVEVLVDVGDAVKSGDVICVVKQMKMELEVRSHRDGICSWVTEADDDEDVAKGMLAAVIEDEKKVTAKL